MKKIVPFKKDITLDTNIAGINSISLEHTLEKTEENVISGNFIISGTYKMTPSSINLDNFEYKLPVNITIDKKYNIDDVTVDINDFYYEVINDRILSINIEVVIDNLEEKSEPLEDKNLDEKEVLEMNIKDRESLELAKENIKTTKEIGEETKEDIKESKENVQKEDTREDVSEKEASSKEENKEIESVPAETNDAEVRDNEEVKSIFSGINDNDNYVVYKIHVVTENDTIENIIEEYQTDRESLEMYNDLANVKIGDKLIIADNGN